MTEPSSQSGGKSYVVGYGRPPKESQFRKGKSGNPAGRPMGAKNKLKITGGKIDDILRRELAPTVEVRGVDGPETLSVLEASVRSLGVRAMKGSVRAQEHLIEKQGDLDAKEAAEHDAHNRALRALKEHQLARRRLNSERGIEDDVVPDPDHIVMDRASARMVIRGPADLQQKVEWERMWEAPRSFRWELELARKKLARLRPRHTEERACLTNTIQENEYFVLFYAMKLMSVFSIEAWQVADDGLEQQELEQRLQEDRWPDPPAEVRRTMSRKKLEALRRGEIYCDAIALRERLRKSGMPPFRFARKPAAQEAFERQQAWLSGAGAPVSSAHQAAAPSEDGEAAPAGELSWIDQVSLLRDLPPEDRSVLRLRARSLLSRPETACLRRTMRPSGSFLSCPARSRFSVRRKMAGRSRPFSSGPACPAFWSWAAPSRWKHTMPTGLPSPTLPPSPSRRKPSSTCSTDRPRSECLCMSGKAPGRLAV